MNRLLKVLLIGSVVALSLGGCKRGDARAAYSAGAKALEKGNMEEALTNFHTVSSNGYYLAEGYRGMGIAYMNKQDYPDACIAFEKSLLEEGQQGLNFHRDVSLYLAFCREHNGETDKANEIYQELLKKNSSDAEVLYLIGRNYLNADDQKNAQRMFDRCLKLREDYNLYINVYQCYAQLGQGADGARYLEEALKLTENDNDYYNKGLVNYYLQNYEEARDLLINALNQDSTNSKAVFLLGEIYLSMDDVADARAVFQQYALNESCAAVSYNGLALCDIAQEDYDSALKNIKEGLKYKNEEANQGLLFNEIVAYEHKHDWETAKAKAIAYVAKYPTDEAGLRESEFLKTR